MTSLIPLGGALQDFAAWVSTTTLHRIASETRWLWATLETLHFLGIGLLIASIGALDLRLLGVAKGLPLAPFQRLVPIGVAAFALEVVTGTIFFFGAPYQYIYNLAFQMKLAFIAVAGANIALFYGAGVSRRTFGVGADRDVPIAGRIAGLISISMWIGVMFWGRMITFFRPPFVVPPQ
jgi:hypothetical protein